MRKSAVMIIVAMLGSRIPLSAAQTLTPFTQKIQLGGDMRVDKMREQNLNVVKKAVEGIKKSLPQKIDAYTTIVNIENNGTKLIYTLMVDGGPKSDKTLREEGARRMAPVVRNGICQSARRFLQSGIDIGYRYLSKRTKKEILRVDVSEKDCEDVPGK